MQRRGHKLFPPEVVQTSAMDCGPASLASLLLGFGVPASYERLRELCRTAVDGTSIDEIETVALDLGLEVEQVLVPPEHLLLPQAPPAIVVVDRGGANHFLLAWRQLFRRWFWVMDPARGRGLVERRRFLRQLHLHTQSVAAPDWLTWVRGEEFQAALDWRLRQLGLHRDETRSLLEEYATRDEWRAWAALDASTRMTATLVEAGTLDRRDRASFLRQCAIEAETSRETIADSFWSVQRDPEDPDRLLYRGAVLVRAHGLRPATVRADVQHVRSTPPRTPVRRVLQLIDRYARGAGFLVVLQVAAAALTLVFEALFFRGILTLHEEVGSAPQRLEVWLALLGLLGVGLLLRWGAETESRRIGLQLETVLRQQLLQRLPRLPLPYLRSRPVSDMARRAHDLHEVRSIVRLGALSVRGACEVLLTSAGMMLIHPPMAPFVALAGLTAIAVPLLSIPLTAEQDAQLRTREGVLARLLFDALSGLTAVRAHRAQAALHHRQREQLVEWVRSRFSVEKLRLLVDLLQLGLVLTLVVATVVDFLQMHGASADVLLLAYWGLELGFWSRLTATGLRRFALQANVVARILEPIEAELEEDATGRVATAEQAASRAPSPVAIRFEAVGVQAGGHQILHGVTDSIEAGQHVAIVGTSGAGKSTLLGLLLGWHEASGGGVWIDERPLNPQTLDALRSRTAWAAPEVQLWNRSLLANLAYGTEGQPGGWHDLLAAAELEELLESMERGLQTSLGESGRRVSGGEGQRVRFGRALRRERADLVLLDEAFRGLGRPQRQRLLRQAREHWQKATLLYATHDVGATLGFDRVLVLDRGTLVEAGSPLQLAQEESQYARLLGAANDLPASAWGPEWRRWRVDQSRLAAVDGGKP